MTFSDFERLPADQQAYIVVQNGVLLIERIVGKYKVILYKLENFYIEGVHDMADVSQPIRIHQIHKDSSHLNSFLHFENHEVSL